MNLPRTTSPLSPLKHWSILFLAHCLEFKRDNSVIVQPLKWSMIQIFDTCTQHLVGSSFWQNKKKYSLSGILEYFKLWHHQDSITFCGSLGRTFSSKLTWRDPYVKVLRNPKPYVRWSIALFPKKHDRTLPFKLLNFQLGICLFYAWSPSVPEDASEWENPFFPMCSSIHSISNGGGRVLRFPSRGRFNGVVDGRQEACRETGGLPPGTRD